MTLVSKLSAYTENDRSSFTERAKAEAAELSGEKQKKSENNGRKNSEREDSCGRVYVWCLWRMA